MNDSFGEKASAIRPVPHVTPLEPALELLRQGNKFASQEQFSDADGTFRTAALLPGGKAMWNFKSLGFCPSLFPDVFSIDAYWQQIDQSLDQALAEHFDVDWRTLPADGFIPPQSIASQVCFGLQSLDEFVQRVALKNLHQKGLQYNLV